MGFASSYIEDPVRLLNDSDMHDRALLMSYPSSGSWTPQYSGCQASLMRSGKCLVRVQHWNETITLRGKDRRTEGKDGDVVRLNRVHDTKSVVRNPSNTERWTNLALLRFYKRTYSGYVIESFTKDGGLLVHLGMDANKRVCKMGILWAVRSAIERHAIEQCPNADSESVIEAVNEQYRALKLSCTGDNLAGAKTLGNIATECTTLPGVSLDSLVACGLLDSKDDVDWKHPLRPHLVTMLAGFQYRLRVVKPVDLNRLEDDMEDIQAIEPGVSLDELKERSSQQEAYKDETGAAWMCLCRLSTRSLDSGVVLDRYVREAKYYPELMPL